MNIFIALNNFKDLFSVVEMIMLFIFEHTLEKHELRDASHVNTLTT